MTRPAQALLGLLSGVLLAGRAEAASDPLYVKNLAPQIMSRCENGSISAAKLREAIEASNVAPLTDDGSWGPNRAQAIARAAFSDARGVNARSLGRLQRLVETWTDPSDRGANDYLPASAGGVHVASRSGGLVPKSEAEGVLAAIYAGDDRHFAFGCRFAALPAEQEEEAAETNFALARAPDDLTVENLSDKPFAEFAYVHNEVKDVSTYSIHATAGLIGPELIETSRRGGEESRRHRWRLRARPVGFIQYEREGSSEAGADEVNNLNFGAQIAGHLETRGSTTRTHYYTISGRYLTDDRFDSSGWSLDATLIPDFGIPGNDGIYYPGNQRRLGFRWLVTLTADHYSISDPGTKAELQTANEFTRLGFDVEGQLRLNFDKAADGGAIALWGQYQLREALGAVVGDVELITARLTFEPILNVGVGLTYTHGENIDSLEFSEEWKFTFGLRW